MSLLDKIEEIRKKPKAERRRTALLASVVLTGVVALIWLSIFLAQKSFSDSGGQNFSQGFSPFSLAKDFIKSIKK